MAVLAKQASNLTTEASNLMNEGAMSTTKARNTANKTLTQSEITTIQDWMPRHFRFGTWAHCFYCGVTPTDKDHVIPWSFYSTDDTHNGDSPGVTTPSCHECNLLLANSFFDTLSLRCEYVNRKIRRRYSKHLHMEVWQPWEMGQLGRTLRSYVVEQQSLREVVVRRASWQFTSDFTELFESAYREAVVNFPDNSGFRAFMKPHWME